MISIDSRTIKKGDTFFAIKGKKFDGHDFVKEAFRKGAANAVVSKKIKPPPGCQGRITLVKDTIKALGDRATSHRLRFNIPVIAVTGSNGKTTAKDMISHVLSVKYNVLKNETSKNNLIGLPLTLLGLKKEHDIAVLEMGMNRLGEIDRLSRIARPGIGVVTNIGPSHLEFLRTLKNVFIAKSELLKRLPADGLVLLNKDDLYLKDIRGLKQRKIYFGISARCEFKARDLSCAYNRWSFSLDSGERFELELLGRHNIYNALIAIVVGRQFGIDYKAIRERIKSFKQTCPMRLEFKNIRGIEMLDDSYNSNPKSLECAIDTLARFNTEGRRILVSGDMLELGKSGKAMHRSIGGLVASSHIDTLITFGRLSSLMSKEAKRRGMKESYHAGSHDDAAAFLRRIAKPGDAVLVKGSRGMEMEKVIEIFKK